MGGTYYPPLYGSLLRPDIRLLPWTALWTSGDWHMQVAQVAWKVVPSALGPEGSRMESSSHWILEYLSPQLTHKSKRL